MTFKFLVMIELTLVVICLYVALGMYVRKLPTWSVPLERRRLAILWVCPRCLGDQGHRGRDRR